MTERDQLAQLLPCPFCGSRDVFADDDPPRVRCECGAKFESYDPTEYRLEHVIADWNSRVRLSLSSETEGIPEGATQEIEPVTGYHVRKCRGHFHVCCDDMDLRLAGDPFPTMEAAVVAMEEAALPPGKPAVNPSGPLLPHREGEPSA